MFQSQVAGASGQLEDRWWGWVGGLVPKPTTKLESINREPVECQVFSNHSLYSSVTFLAPCLSSQLLLNRVSIIRIALFTTKGCCLVYDGLSWH